MIDHAWEYAAKNAKLRKNEQHGEEEIKIVLDDTFFLKEEQGEATHESTAHEVEES